jgi:hypothetical protein
MSECRADRARIRETDRTLDEVGQRPVIASSAGHTPVPGVSRCPETVVGVLSSRPLPATPVVCSCAAQPLRDRVYTSVNGVLAFEF